MLRLGLERRRHRRSVLVSISVGLRLLRLWVSVRVRTARRLVLVRRAHASASAFVLVLLSGLKGVLPLRAPVPIRMANGYTHAAALTTRRRSARCEISTVRHADRLVLGPAPGQVAHFVASTCWPLSVRATPQDMAGASATVNFVGPRFLDPQNSAPVGDEIPCWPVNWARDSSIGCRAEE
jgi:hypothetical protein